MAEGHSVQGSMDPSLQSSDKDKRSVKPTWKVRENLESLQHELASDIMNLWKTLQAHVSTMCLPEYVLPLEGALEQLSTMHEQYKLKCEEYHCILKRINTQDSLEELQNFQHLNVERDGLIYETKSKIKARIMQPHETTSCISESTRRSKRTSRSRSSKYSTLSEQLIKARAEAEATKIQATFAQKRAELEAAAAQKKAEMEADAAQKKAAKETDTARRKAEIEALQKQCEHATAMARLKVLERAASGSERDSVALSGMDAEDPLKRTRDYVLSQNSADISSQQQHIIPSAIPQNQDQYNTLPVHHPDTSLRIINHGPTPLQAHHRSTQVQAKMPNPNNGLASYQATGKPMDSKPPPGLNAYAASFTPVFLSPNSGDNVASTTQPALPCPSSERTDMSEFARYMLRRELTKTGLTRFDDQPENYRGWKCAFRTAISDLGITAAEELDLLIRWLGPQSTERIKRLRSVHIGNPAAGLTSAWERLERTYGSPEAIESALFKRLQGFPKISGKDNQKFQELSDLLSELQLAKTDTHLPGLSYLDTARGVNQIVAKLPYGFQEKWTTVGSRYKRENQVSFPPFDYFCEFISNIAESKNDPSFYYGESSGPGSPPSKYDSPRSEYRKHRGPVSVKKTDVLPTTSSASEEPSYKNNQGEKIENPNRQCPIHKKPHPLKKCIGFRRKPLQERKELLKKFGVCFRCCASTEHVAKDCKTAIKCIECDSENHVQALHPSQSSPTPPTDFPPLAKHGGENTDQAAKPTTVSSSCTEVCGEDLCDKSCARICLVNVYPKGQPEKTVKVYAILDDQSNRSLARSELFDLFNLKGDAYPYTLGTCSGITEVSGRRASGLVVASLNGNLEVPLPTLVECNQIPSNREEIPTPEAALHHPHLRTIASEIPALDNNAEILLLLGRDILRVHKIRQQINGPHDAPFAQRLDLGWVIIGNVCIDRMKWPTKISSFKTHILPNGRSTYFQPCPHHYLVKEKMSNCKGQHDQQDDMNICLPWDDNLGSTVFNITSDDNKLAPAREDKEFLKVMDKEFTQNDSNSWVAPLPFRTPRTKLPNNLQQAASRFSSLKRTLKRRPEMEKHFVDFMQKVFDRDHAEPAPPLKEGEECWYLPSFGVYHPRKPDQIRVVFDSSAQFEGVSLNNMLLTGPNLNNSLLGVLMRFRQEPVAVMADIQQMFHCFIVKEDNRNYLRFLWHKDNNVNKEVIDYRMKVHVFGNSPSPAVATYGLRRTAQQGEKEYGSDARRFVERNFYVDDGLKSLPTSEEAVDLLTRTQEMLSAGNLRLHKIISNSHEVMKAFPSDDHAINLRNLDLSSDAPPVRSLGLLWNIEQDTFTFQVSPCDKPFTKRGVLSVVNSIYDPLGFIAPITIQGKILLRQLTTENADWDSQLPIEKQQRWEKWKRSLEVLEQLQVPRCYAPSSLSAAIRREVHIFSDASMEAIAAVAYLRITGVRNETHCGFVLGKAKLTPKPAHSIPRLELCAAVLAVEIAEVSAIINARPLVPVSSDPDSPIILTPATLLTQKIGTSDIPPGTFDHSDIYRRQWKQVQHLSNVFWYRWKSEYLHMLQSRHKWQTSKPNLQEGDLVLLKDKEAHRNEWPMGLITKVIPSDDGKTRKVEVKVTKGGSAKVFFRPIHELVLLLPKEEVT
ncbi:uncharacterized protein [Dendropsophus ebraccatus]|uniref:uncharacterized protein n=1 Tax=Dendropsophus ebraccatus TaxID=150705 RepID=UPI003831947B